LIAVETMAEIMFSIAFADESQVRRLIEKYQAQVIAVSYTESTQMQLSMKEKQITSFIDELTEMLKGQVQISLLI
jgi:putative IMPACT (imprinted ancient) family translation regulator